MYQAEPETEKKEIVKRYRDLLRVSIVKNPADRKLIRKAFDLAADAHKDMRRHSGEPYIYHPLEVAMIVAGEIGMGTTSIVSALLHDVVEDTNYTLEDIRFHFGDKVALIIDGLTKIDEMIDKPTVSPQAENFRKILLTLSQDVRVIIIKLADRLHNMRTLEAGPWKLCPSINSSRFPARRSISTRHWPTGSGFSRSRASLRTFLFAPPNPRSIILFSRNWKQLKATG